MEEKKILDDRNYSVRKQIAELEREKLEIKRRIEEIMAVMAKESGVASLKKRKYEVGAAPNDWFAESEE